jgi:hypothetical protein
VQIVLKIFGAFTAAVSIINAEYLYIRPILDWRQLVDGMDYIKNDRYSIFIILADQSNVSVRTE